MSNDQYPMTKKSKLTILLFLTVLSGCIRDVTIRENIKTRELVLNCIPDARKDTVTARLTWSKPIQPQMHFEAVENAAIRFFENGEAIGEFVWADSSTYILPFSVTPGKTYRIEAEAGNQTVWAETTVPKTVEASIGVANPENAPDHYLISLQDDRENANFYWVSATGYEGIEENRGKNIACLIYSNFEHADDYNQYTSDNGFFKFEYDYYLRFADNQLPDGWTDVLFRPQCIGMPIEVFLLSADYHLDKYMKSSLMLERMDLYAEDMPIIYAPFPVYSNIHGGTGIFGSFSSASKVFTKN